MENPEVENQANGDEKPEVEVNVDVLQQQLTKLQSQNERLLNESKTHADKYRKLRDSVEGKQREELEKNENWKELLEREKQEKFELGEQMKSLRENSLRQNLNYEVAKYANDAHKVERVIGAVLDSSDVQVSEDGSNFVGVKEAIEALRNDEPYLFRQDKPAAMVNSNPSAKSPKGKTLNEMSSNERDIVFKESIKDMLSKQRR